MKRSIIFGTVMAAAATIALFATRPTSPDPSSDCERIYVGLIRQPSNTLSALGLTGVGLFLITRGNRRQRILGIGVGIAGVGSVLAHATLHPVAMRLDGVGVAVASTAAIVALSETGTNPRRLLIATVVLVAGIVFWTGSRTGHSWCDPAAPVGGHAVWHVLVAVATLIAASALIRRDAEIKS